MIAYEYHFWKLSFSYIYRQCWNWVLFSVDINFLIVWHQKLKILWVVAVGDSPFKSTVGLRVKGTQTGNCFGPMYIVQYSAYRLQNKISNINTAY